MFAIAYRSRLIPRTVNFGKSNRIGSEWRTGPMVYPGKEKRGQFKASDCVEAAARMRVTARYSGAADDLGLADETDRRTIYLTGIDANGVRVSSLQARIGHGYQLLRLTLARKQLGSPALDQPQLFGPKEKLQLASVLCRSARHRAAESRLSSCLTLVSTFAFKPS
jgi:hypothetical protein